MYRENIMIVEIDSLSKNTIHNLSKMDLQYIENKKVFRSRNFKDFAIEKLTIIYSIIASKISRTA